ncbi:MAG TPA: DUF3562 domain-containing protein [Usitatibacter sp.]|nr:DUF3562 domain-containing protein [Usitatibacter sp.]
MKPARSCLTMDRMNLEMSRVHRTAIRELARSTQRSEDEVRQVFEAELRETEKDARVKNFVPVFAQRRALERLRPPARRQ